MVIELDDPVAPLTITLLPSFSSIMSIPVAAFAEPKAVPATIIATRTDNIAPFLYVFILV